ncbi:MAG: endonuclease/exonuclease/phosphatase family protein [Thermoanaerobaculia bacterium]|nr:endonuclease/exonuclease/phosphatase family protein [Thermoanaerobaculia bacterium]
MASKPIDDERARTALFGLTALTVVLGMQCFRVFLPLLAFLLRDRFGWNPIELGGLSLGVFALGFLVPWAFRSCSLRRALWTMVGTLALARFTLQLWTGDPLVDLVLAGLGLAAFVMGTPFLLLLGRSLANRRAAAISLTLGWLLGLLLDVVIHSAYGSWDLAWREGVPHVLVAGAFLVGTCALLASIPLSSHPFRPPALRGVLAWAGVWPLMFLYAGFLGLTARFEALSPQGHSGPLFLSVALVLASTPWWLPLPRAARLLIFGSAAVFLLAVSGKLGIPEPGSALFQVAGLVAAAVVLGCLLSRAVGGVDDGGQGPLGIGHGLGKVLFLTLTFGTTSAWEVPIPIPVSWLPAFAALTAVILALGSGAAITAPPAERRVGRLALFGVGVVLAAASPSLPTHLSGAGESHEAARADWPIRVVTYNVHCGIDPSGRLDLEALATTLENESPDVVVLQEVSRGWLLNGGVDLPKYLSHRLGMPFIFHGTADATWGNAVLTRLPIARVEQHPLPPDDLLLRRGYLDVEVEVGHDDRLRVLTTHFHHPRDGGEERLAQSRALIEAWEESPRTALAGDLNALPEHREIGVLAAAGLRDAHDLAGQDDGFTFPSWNPVRRIDYIWLSPDLTALNTWVSSSAASDHSPVVAVIGPTTEPKAPPPAVTEAPEN